MLLARGFFNRTEEHINVHELEAMCGALLAFLPRRRTSTWLRVRLKVDNQVAMYAIRALCSPSVQIIREIRLLFYVLETRRVLLFA